MQTQSMKDEKTHNKKQFNCVSTSDLDPCAGIILSQHFNEYEEATILYREALQLDPDFWPGR